MVDPSRMKLPIRPKENSRFQTRGWCFPVRNTHSDKGDRSVCSESDDPLINHLWSYKTDNEEGWRELPPPPCALGYSIWNRTTVSTAMLKSLDPIKPRLTFIDVETTKLQDLSFANYEFVVEES